MHPGLRPPIENPYQPIIAPLSCHIQQKVRTPALGPHRKSLAGLDSTAGVAMVETAQLHRKREIAGEGYGT